jgi:hypothetical protein
VLFFDQQHADLTISPHLLTPPTNQPTNQPNKQTEPKRPGVDQGRPVDLHKLVHRLVPAAEVAVSASLQHSGGRQKLPHSELT